MHGNPQATTGARTGLESGSADTELNLWLALSAARAHFDRAKLSAEDQLRSSVQHSAHRRADFEVSRALLAYVDAGTAAFSHSHSTEHAALLLGPTDWRVGVDLELDRPRDVLRLARFGFTEREIELMEAASAEARSPLFYTLWTLKEAFAKALGLDLVDALQQCVFWHDAGKWDGRVPTTATWGAAVFQPRPGIFLSAAWIGGSSPARLQQWEWPPKQRADWPLIASASGPAVADAARA
ncbi:4'-phosphopantetheinyl transferase superfamily protein [Steroidobacter sp. S1-65]|uniref:4'-phosphopantetheinyl transferase superfamily protein n=1 Tax=Steroidobacter gossypii TaxID=2805490 RepID=A0ABS1WTY7_9GAMM|nr:4'-phosphopantetheinyl transferase superfamily protein [Steroidobacter gossypii]MBM0104429.1 4'-phosphopantetheinyl transferase superfamily protein [Steroidobacter gossypii]